MAQRFRLKKAEEVRKSVVMIQQKRIKKMYEQLFEDISVEIDKKGERMSTRYLKDLAEQIEDNVHDLNESISNENIKQMNTVCENVVEGKRKVMSEMGFRDIQVSNAFIHVPSRVVSNIINGNVYQDGWSLSRSIWSTDKQVHYKINRILAEGAARGESAYDTAKKLEKYVMPDSKKRSRVIEWKDENGRVRRFYFGNVDYNAQRLARTMIGHAYQQSFETVNRYDPFVTGYIWMASGLHGRMCKVCEDRDGQFFKKNELPLDHPNGMCTFEAYMPDDMGTINERLNNWYNSPIGTYPEIDRYAVEFLD